MFTRDRSWARHETSTGIVVPFRVRDRKGAALTASRRDDDAPLATGPAARTSLLQEEELRAIESTYSHGITAAQIVEAFTSRGIRFSEASFRKYVQQGLLPRSVRVGRKGKNKGSLGLYPAKTVRRINAVKQWMADGHTIEQIQEQFLLYTDLVEGVSENLETLWTRLGDDAQKLPERDRREVDKDLADARREGDRVLARLDQLTRRVAAPRTDSLRLATAAGGAEDLL